MKFTKALRYEVDVTCLSALRTAPADADSKDILHNGRDAAILQGASLAGALRAWRENGQLFGSGREESTLIVSDLVFQQSETAIRPRVRIDGRSGTAAQKAKFYVTALVAGIKGHFSLVWRGETDPQTAARDVEAYLAALNRGEICLGAQKANGFGRVSVQACRRTYDLMAQEDRQAWLEGGPVTEPVILADGSDQYTTFRVRGRTPAMLVKASTGSGYGANKIDAVHYKEDEQFIVPGSSIKGAVRAQIVRFAPFFGAEEAVERLFGRPNGAHSSGIAGRLRFGDGKYETPKASEAFSRIRINRFTGSVMGTGLYTQQTVSGTLCWDITVPAEEAQGCGLILYALRDLGLGLYHLGSGSAVGFGGFESLEVEISTPKGCGTLLCRDGAVTLTDPEGILAGWQKTLGGAAQ